MSSRTTKGDKLAPVLFILEIPLLWNDYSMKLLRLQDLMIAVCGIGVAFTTAGAITIACSQSWLGSTDPDTLRYNAKFLVISTIIFLFSLVSAWLSRLLRIIASGKDLIRNTDSDTYTQGGATGEDVPELFQERFRKVLAEKTRRGRDSMSSRRVHLTLKLLWVVIMWAFETWAFHLNLNTLFGPVAAVLVAFYPLVSIIESDLEWLMVGFLITPVGVATSIVLGKVLLHQYRRLKREVRKQRATELIGTRSGSKYSSIPGPSGTKSGAAGVADGGSERLSVAIERLVAVLENIRTDPQPSGSSQLLQDTKDVFSGTDKI